MNIDEIIGNSATMRVCSLPWGQTHIPNMETKIQLYLGLQRQSQ
jgi:hypothetical protein